MTPEELQSALDKATASAEKANAEAAAHRKGKAEERERADSLQRQIDDIAAKQKADETDKLKKENKHEEVWARDRAELEAANAKLKESAEQAFNQYKSLAINGKIIEAAAKHKAHDPKIITQLLSSDVGVDDKGDVFVRSGDGVAMNEKGERVSIESHVQNYLAKNAYLVQPSGAGGGAAGGAGGGSKKSMTRSEFDGLSLAEQSNFSDSVSKGAAELVD